jgi:hypothetical protein
VHLRLGLMRVIPFCRVILLGFIVNIGEFEVFCNSSPSTRCGLFRYALRLSLSPRSGGMRSGVVTGFLVQHRPHRLGQFLEDGFDQGQRPDLTGGGLVRSHAGWTPTTHRESPMKGDERILGDASFVMDILTEAEETLLLEDVDPDPRSG